MTSPYAISSELHALHGQNVWQLLTSFVRELDDNLMSLVEARDSQNIITCRGILHQMIGTSRIVGHHELVETLLATQKEIKNDGITVKFNNGLIKVEDLITEVFDHLGTSRIAYKILLCDEQTQVAETLKSLLEDMNDRLDISICSSKSSCSEMVKRHRPNLFVTEIAMNGKNLEDILDSLEIVDSQLPVVVWSLEPFSEIEEFALVHPNLRGYVSKTSGLEAIMDCWTTVANGRECFPELTFESNK